MFSAFLATMLATGAHAAGPVGPAMVVKQVAPPPQLVSGVKTLEIKQFSGTDVDVVSQVKTSLANQERLKSDAAAVGKEALGMAMQISPSLSLSFHASIAASASWESSRAARQTPPQTRRCR